MKCFHSLIIIRYNRIYPNKLNLSTCTLITINFLQSLHYATIIKKQCKIYLKRKVDIIKVVHNLDIVKQLLNNTSSICLMILFSFITKYITLYKHYYTCFETSLRI